MTTVPRPLPRLPLALVCLPSAALLFWAAWVLPWTRLTAFATASASLGALHLVVGTGAALRWPPVRRPLRLLGFCSLLYLAWIAQQTLGAGLYVAEIYGSLGEGVAAGLSAFVLLTALLTLPIGAWALALTAPEQRPRTLLAFLFGAALLFAMATGATWARARSADLPTPEGLEQRLREALPSWAALPAAAHRPALLPASPVRCARPPASDMATAVVVYADRRGRVVAQCLQDSVAELPHLIATRIAQHATRGPVKLDWLTGAHMLQPHPGLLGPLVDVLSLRPGLDGVCKGQQCLMPFQLLARGVFAAREPTPYVPKMRLGFAVRAVRAALGGDGMGVEGLLRVTTHSLLIDGSGALRTLRRMRPTEVPVTAETLERAQRAAESYVLAAQFRDGTFRYELDAYNDRAVRDNPSIPRHAGTTLVLCEFGQRTPQVQRAIEGALSALAGYQRALGPIAALTYQATQPYADLGSSALGLVALSACRARGGARHDGLIAGLARFLLEQQRSDGSFGPGFDLRARAPLPGPTPVFAGGQAIMGLSLLEGVIRALPQTQRGRFPALATVHEAVERAMNHVARDYWPSPLRDFFFLKENWHCLAARAALPYHRNDGYERFCLDYVRFKTRLLLESDDGVDPDLVGGYGFGNVVPPHNGSSAGLGEALGAAVALRRARGEDESEELSKLRLTLGFLLRQQAHSELCFACRSKVAEGWFSGFMVEPTGRIDHIQHPWSALGHGARVLSQ